MRHQGIVMHAEIPVIRHYGPEIVKTDRGVQCMILQTGTGKQFTEMSRVQSDCCCGILRFMFHGNIGRHPSG